MIMVLGFVIAQKSSKESILKVWLKIMLKQSLAYPGNMTFH